MNSKILALAGNAISAPAIAGIAVGAGIVILFSVLFIPVISPDAQRTWISYEPTQCSTMPWISHRSSLQSDQNFLALPEEGQHQIIKDYYKEVGIAVFDIKYRISSSPNCEACTCSAGYIIDFNMNESDVDKLRENILKATVQVDGT